MSAIRVIKQLFFGALICSLALLPLHAKKKSEKSSKKESLTAEQIIEQHAAKNKVDSELEFVKIVTVDPEGTTTRYSILFLTEKRDDGSFDYLLRVISPTKYSGVGILINSNADGESNRYMFLPALGKVKQLKGAKGGMQSFLGSNFAYDDLVKEIPGRYEYELIGDDEIDDVAVHVIKATNDEQSSETDMSYRKLYIGKDDYNIYKIEFFNLDDELTKSLSASDYNSTKVDGPTMRPLYAEMRDHEAHTTSILTVVRSRFNIDIDPAMFTPENLGEWSPEKRTKLLQTFVYSQDQ